MTAHAVEGDGPLLDGPLLDGPLLDDSASAGGAFIGAEFVGAVVGSPGVAAAIDALGLAGLLAARSEARRLVEDDGITYGVGARGHGRGRSTRFPWSSAPTNGRVWRPACANVPSFSTSS
jgi:hypothetical protein